MRCIWIYEAIKEVDGKVRLIVTWDVFECGKKTKGHGGSWKINSNMRCIWMQPQVTQSWAYVD